MNKADTQKVRKTLENLQQLMKSKKINGLVVVPGRPEYNAMHAIEGHPDELVANIAFMAYSHPLTLEILQKAVNIAVNRLNERLTDDDFRKN